jgi:nucleotide sugar dehydrogenase
MRKISIIGHGSVGKAVERFFKDRADIIIYDPGQGCKSRRRVNGSDLAFVCVPTARLEDGSCDISVVEYTVSWLVSDVIIIKSTIEPGTTDNLFKKYEKPIVFSPEYISESFYHNPIMREIADQPYIILGGRDRDCRVVQDILSRFTGPLVEFFTCTALEAELIKYFENVFFAVKVGFANEMMAICDMAGADYYKVRHGWLLDPRINPMHTLAFRFARGFSGKCLPKDLAAFTAWFKKRWGAIGYKAPIIEAAGAWEKKNAPD